MVSIQVLATPISGLRRSASVKPIALNMERAGAGSRPSVMPRLRCLRSMGKDYNMSRPPKWRFIPNGLSSRMACDFERSEGPRGLPAAATLTAHGRRRQEPRALALLGMTGGLGRHEFRDDNRRRDGIQIKTGNPQSEMLPEAH